MSSSVNSPRSKNTRQSPPIRLPENTYSKIASTAAMEMRTVPMQVSYMLEVAQLISEFVGREDLFNIKSGFAKLVVEPTKPKKFDADDLLGEVDRQRKSGALAKSVTGAKVVFQASLDHPGLIERIDRDSGAVEVGTFRGGKFRKVRVNK